MQISPHRQVQSTTVIRSFDATCGRSIFVTQQFNVQTEHSRVKFEYHTLFALEGENVCRKCVYSIIHFQNFIGMLTPFPEEGDPLSDSAPPALQKASRFAPRPQVINMD